MWPLTFTFIMLVIEIGSLVYEQLVLVPNYFGGDPLAGKSALAAFLTVSTPLTFHALFSTLMLVGLVVVVKDWHGSHAASVRAVLLAVLATGLLTAVAVTRLNGAVFFDDPVSGDLQRLVIAWSAVNIARILLLSFACRTIWLLRNEACV